jgi:hypothetical protein
MAGGWPWHWHRYSGRVADQNAQRKTLTNRMRQNASKQIKPADLSNACNIFVIKAS